MTRGAAFGWTATVLVIVVGLGGCLALVGPSANNENQGDCGLVHRYEGALYSASSDPPRQPRGVRVVGTAEQIACGEVIGHVDAYEVAGVSPQVAVVLEGYLSVRDGSSPPRRLMRAAQRPIRCTRPTVFEATWSSSLETARNEGPDVNEDGSSVRPYRLEVDATAGDHAAFARWQRLRLTVLVTAETEFAREDEHKASYDLVPMLISTHCNGDNFLADRIELEPSRPRPS